MANRKKGNVVGTRLWFVLHGWLSLPIWGLLSIICITGTLCAISEEITWLFNPEVRALNKEGVPPLSFGAISEAVAETYPGVKIDSIQVKDFYLTYKVRASQPDGTRKVLHVNPYNGRVQGEARGVGFAGFMLALHGWLLFPWQDNYSVGWYLVTAVSIPLLGSLITGLLVFKRFWRVYYRPRLRIDKGARIFWGDFHRLLGGWSIWFVLVISLSALWFLVQGVLYQNHIDIFPQTPQLSSESLPVTTDGQPPGKISVDQAVAATRAVYPDLQIKYIEFPKNAYSVQTITGKRGFPLFRDTANAVYLNPYTGEPVRTRGIEGLTALQLISVSMVPLHFGDFGGLVFKLIWFLFGGLLSIMVCSGFFIWSRRTLVSTKKLRARDNDVNDVVEGILLGGPK